MSTISILEQGGTELNPLMDQVLQLGTAWFVGLKVAIASTSSIALYVYREKCRLLVNTGVTLCLMVYLPLMVWQSYLLCYSILYF